MKVFFFGKEGKGKFKFVIFIKGYRVRGEEIGLLLNFEDLIRSFRVYDEVSFLKKYFWNMCSKE